MKNNMKRKILTSNKNHVLEEDFLKEILYMIS